MRILNDVKSIYTQGLQAQIDTKKNVPARTKRAPAVNPITAAPAGTGKASFQHITARKKELINKQIKYQMESMQKIQDPSPFPRTPFDWVGLGLGLISAAIFALLIRANRGVNALPHDKLERKAELAARHLNRDSLIIDHEIAKSWFIQNPLLLEQTEVINGTLVFPGRTPAATAQILVVQFQRGTTSNSGTTPPGGQLVRAAQARRRLVRTRASGPRGIIPRGR